MKKRFDFYTIIVVILCVILILGFAVMLANAVRATAADLEVQEITEQAQARIDLYRMASTPATERPSAAVIVYEERPVVEALEPFPEPSLEPVEDWYIESLPLDKPLQKSVFDAACESGVDYFTALGLIKVESNFLVDAVNPVTGCRELCQLSPVYFPGEYTPEENISAGMEYLGQLIEGHNGDVPAALRAYNHGYDDGARGYSNAVLSAADEIMSEAGVVFP